MALAAIGMLELVRKRIGVRRDYESIYSLGVAFAAFAAGESVHGSGFLAAFAAGLVISALDLELCDCFLEYGETTGEMALMFAFVLFGVSVIWNGLAILGAGTLLFVVTVFAARPIAFLPALWPSGLSWKNRAFIAWFGPRGLSSLLLVLLPVFEGLPQSDFLLTTCCLVVLFSVVLHGLTPGLLIKSPARSSRTAPLPQTAADPVLRVAETSGEHAPTHPNGDANKCSTRRGDTFKHARWKCVRIYFGSTGESVTGNTGPAGDGGCSFPEELCDQRRDRARRRSSGSATVCTQRYRSWFAERMRLLHFSARVHTTRQASGWRVS